MKKLLSSLFTKYMLTFIGIMFLSNVVATGLMFLYYGIDARFVRLMAISRTTPQMAQFALSMGLTTFVFSGMCISIAVRFLVKPIKKLSLASKAVAQGDFEIYVDVKGNDEVADLAKNFNKMTQALSRNELLHKDFVSNVSHEFKTPLTSIRGYTKLLKKSGLSEEKKTEYLDIIISETERLATMSSSLLKLSELENDLVPLHCQAYNLDEQIRDVFILLQPDWEAAKLNVVLELEEVSFWGDQALLYQVWVNLVGNAIKYSKVGGQLKVCLQGGGQITVAISDEGEGMTAEVQGRIFERFYKADASRHSQGTGLGLAISKRIIVLHGGKVEVTSEVGVGSTFYVSLPRLQCNK